MNDLYLSSRTVFTMYRLATVSVYRLYRKLKFSTIATERPVNF